jgi:hypothetical protein
LEGYRWGIIFGLSLKLGYAPIRFTARVKKRDALMS